MNDFKGVDMFKKLYNIYDKLLNDVAKQNSLTLNQLKVLMFLEKNNENDISKNIVEGLGSAKSQVSMSVSDLEKKDYLEKIQDENDKKKNHLILTEKSMKIIKEGKKAQKELKEIMFEGITEEELKLLNDISKRIKENLEKHSKN